MEAVLRDLEQDTTIEIASGVAQVNHSVEQMRIQLLTETTGHGKKTQHKKTKECRAGFCG